MTPSYLCNVSNYKSSQYSHQPTYFPITSVGRTKYGMSPGSRVAGTNPLTIFSSPRELLRPKAASNLQYLLVLPCALQHPSSRGMYI